MENRLFLADSLEFVISITPAQEVLEKLALAAEFESLLILDVLKGDTSKLRNLCLRPYLIDILDSLGSIACLKMCLCSKEIDLSKSHPHIILRSAPHCRSLVCRVPVFPHIDPFAHLDCPVLKTESHGHHLIVVLDSLLASVAVAVVSHECIVHSPCRCYESESHLDSIGSKSGRFVTVSAPSEHVPGE